jgi:hypothetical protein
MVALIRLDEALGRSLFVHKIKVDENFSHSSLEELLFLSHLSSFLKIVVRRTHVLFTPYMYFLQSIFLCFLSSCY